MKKHKHVKKHASHSHSGHHGHHPSHRHLHKDAIVIPTIHGMVGILVCLLVVLYLLTGGFQYFSF